MKTALWEGVVQPEDLDPSEHQHGWILSQWGEAHKFDPKILRRLDVDHVMRMWEPKYRLESTPLAMQEPAKAEIFRRIQLAVKDRKSVV